MLYDAKKLIEVCQWGGLSLGYRTIAQFAGTGNFKISASDAPDLRKTDSLRLAFFQSSFNQDIENWDTSTVMNMSGMFYGAEAFNQDIGGWNTELVVDMSSMFSSARAFNQDIGGWNTKAVIDMSSMFYKAEAFNQDIGGWNTEAVVEMQDQHSEVRPI